MTGMERFPDIHIRTVFDTLDLIFHRRFRRKQYHRNMFGAHIVLHLLQEREPVHYRHHHIAQYQIGHHPLHLFQCLLPVARLNECIPLAQCTDDKLPYFGLVVDHQYRLHILLRHILFGQLGQCRDNFADSRLHRSFRHIVRRNQYGKRRIFIDLAIDRNRTVEQTHQILAHRQSDAVTGVNTLRQFRFEIVQHPETVEYRLQHFGRDTGTAVRTAEHQLPVFRQSQHDIYRTVCGRIFERIGKQVENHFFKGIAVEHPCRYAFIEIERQPDFFLLRQFQKTVGSIFDQLLHIHRFEMQSQVSGLRLAELHQLLYLLLHPLGIALDDIQQLPRLSIQFGIVYQPFARTVNQCDRIGELVCDIRKETQLRLMDPSFFSTSNRSISRL